MKFNTFLLGFVALCVAGSAAAFSVTGLSQLFAGASLAIIIMAGSLETAKLVVASYLHNRWSEISKLMRTYLVTAVIVLVVITSAGIYGFLTAAYQTTADELQILDRQLETIELKKDRFQEQLDDLGDEQEQLNQSITNLTQGLANNQIQYTDSLGNVITTTSSSTRQALTDQLNDQKEQRTFIRQRIEAVSDSVTSLDVQALEFQQGNEVAAEVGPLRYMADITGLPMSSIVNYFALLIIFVFDPLAVAMVISFNHALMIDRGEKKKKEVEEGKKKGYKVYNEGDFEKHATSSVFVPHVQVDEDLSDEEWDEIARGRGEEPKSGFAMTRGMEWPDYDLFDEAETTKTLNKEYDEDTEPIQDKDDSNESEKKK